MMTDYPRSGRSQGHVTHIDFGAQVIFLERINTRHFKIDLQIERKES